MPDIKIFGKNNIDTERKVNGNGFAFIREKYIFDSCFYRRQQGQCKLYFLNIVKNFLKSSIIFKVEVCSKPSGQVCTTESAVLYFPF